LFWTGELTAKMSWRRSPKRARGCLGRGSGSGLILYHRFPTIKPVNIRLLFLGTRKARRFDRIAAVEDAVRALVVSYEQHLALQKKEDELWSK